MTDTAAAVPAPASVPAASSDAKDMSCSEKETTMDQQAVVPKGCVEPKTPVSKKALPLNPEVQSPVTPAPTIPAPGNAMMEPAPSAAPENEAPAGDAVKPTDEVPAEKKSDAPAADTQAANGSPVTPAANPSTLEEDNEVPTPTSTGEKIKLKPLSPTAEPFVMSSTKLFPETPKKDPVSHVPVNTIDVSGSLPPVTPNRSRGSPRTSPNAPISPHVELSAKQVRELRRLCRKTANRAEYEGRLVQLRQIASILAMGGPSLVHFAPSYLAAHSAMQAWLDAARAAGADWRDERQLSIAAVEELREWDRLLKAWAKRRFPTLADVDGGSAPPTTPRSKRVEMLNMSSPVSGNSPTPARALVSSHQAGSPASTRNRNVTGTGGNNSFVQSHMSISTDGDTINVSIVRTPDKPSATKSTWRNVTPRREQENVHPESSTESPRDWGSLRKKPSAGDVVPSSTPLKTRNW